MKYMAFNVTITALGGFSKYTYILLVPFTHLFINVANSEELCGSSTDLSHLGFNDNQSQHFKPIFYNNIKVSHCSKQ